MYVFHRFSPILIKGKPLCFLLGLLYFTFMLHVDLIFYMVQSMGWGSLFCMGIFVLGSFAEKTVLSPLNYLNLCWKSVDHICVGLFEDLWSIPLICVSIPLPIPYFLNYFLALYFIFILKSVSIDPPTWWGSVGEKLLRRHQS